MPIRRRDFLALAASLAALRGVPASSLGVVAAPAAGNRAGAAGATATDAELLEYVRQLFAHSDATPFARAYTAAFPADAPRDALLAPLRAACQRAGETSLHHALAAAIDADFRNEDVVTVGGWLLARTEARLCALAALG